MKKAFTMAEVLITLGVIGIVAAMTIPQLVKNYQLHVLQNQFKAVYSDLNRASQLFKLHNDFSVSEYAYLNGSGRALELFKKEFKTIKNSNVAYDNLDENGVRIEPYTLYNIQGSHHTWFCDKGDMFVDAQGRVFSFDDAPRMNNENGPKVCVDINGVKKPNRYGIDNFVFMFTVDGQVIPFGTEHKNNPGTGTIYENYYIENPQDYCKYTSSSTKQVACAYFALSDTHPEGNGKSYWRDFIGKGNKK